MRSPREPARTAPPHRSPRPNTTLLHRALAATAALVLLPAVAAQGGPLWEYGGRVGLSTTPDQLVLGAFGVIHDFSPTVAFRPSGDLGLGNSVVTLIGNADVQYTFRTAGRGPVPFFGGGLGLLWFDPDGGDSGTDLGLQLYGGVEWAQGGYKSGVLEVRVGLTDEMPDFKMTYGFGFY